jgi:hypothetical protein
VSPLNLSYISLILLVQTYTDLWRCKFQIWCLFSICHVVKKKFAWHCETWWKFTVGICCPLSNSKAGGLLLVGCPRLVPQCIVRYPVYLEAFCSVRYAVVTRGPLTCGDAICDEGGSCSRHVNSLQELGISRKFKMVVPPVLDCSPFLIAKNYVKFSIIKYA